MQLTLCTKDVRYAVTSVCRRVLAFFNFFVVLYLVSFRFRPQKMSQSETYKMVRQMDASRQHDGGDSSDSEFSGGSGNLWGDQTVHWRPLADNVLTALLFGVACSLRCALTILISSVIIIFQTKLVFISAEHNQQHTAYTRGACIILSDCSCLAQTGFELVSCASVARHHGQLFWLYWILVLRSEVCWFWRYVVASWPVLLTNRSAEHYYNVWWPRTTTRARLLKPDHPLFDWLINCVILNHF